MEMFDSTDRGHEGSRAPSSSQEVAWCGGTKAGPAREKQQVQAKAERRGPAWRPAPNTHTDRHKHTAHCKTAPTPRHDLPWWFTWPGPRSPRGQPLSHRVGLCQAALFCSKGPCPPGRAGRTGDLAATPMEPSWAALGQAHWLGTLHAPQDPRSPRQDAGRSQARRQLSKAILNTSSTGKPQSTAKFCPKFQPANTTTKYWN